MTNDSLNLFFEKEADFFETSLQYTQARIGLGRAGNSLTTKHLLEFKLAHAHARDAVYSELNAGLMQVQLVSLEISYILLKSKVRNREEYLQRPDFGRQLSEGSITELEIYPDKGYDIVIVIADGLSATAVYEYAARLLTRLIPALKGAGFTVAPVCLVQQGRVALADDVAHFLKARLSLILIGERPGLSAHDSMGAYITYNPKPGLTDEARNCISNIRPQGLDIFLAADKIFYLISESFKRKLSGVGLKDHAGLLDGAGQ